MTSKNAFNASESSKNSEQTNSAQAEQQYESPPANLVSNEHDEHSVADYLLNNPDFFQRQPELLATIDLQQKNERSNTISLTQRQIQSLRNRNQRYENKLQALIQTAKKNEDIYNQTKEIIVDIIAQESLTDLLMLLNSRLTHHYKLAASNMVLFSEYFNPHEHSKVISRAEAEAMINSIVSSRHVICGTLRDNELDFLFAEKAAVVKSAAVAPLILNENTFGILALGSGDSDHFQTGSETDLIDFLTNVICISLNRLRNHEH